MIKDLQKDIESIPLVSPRKSRKNVLKLPLLKSPGYNTILKTENMKELAKDYLRKNNDIFRYIKMANNDILLRNISKSLKILAPEPDNVYGNVIKSLIRLHSSNYHSKKNEEKKKTLNDEFEEVMKQLKIPKPVKPWDINNEMDIKEENDNIFKYRKRLAFKYRYLSVNKSKKIHNNKNKVLKNIRKNNKKMKKLFKISKSIPSYLLPKNIDSERNESLYKESINASPRIQSSNFSKSINTSVTDKDNSNYADNPYNNKKYYYKKKNLFNFYYPVNIKKKNDDNSFISDNELYCDKLVKIIDSYDDKNESDKKIVKTIERDGNKYIKNLNILLS